MVEGPARNRSMNIAQTIAADGRGGIEQVAEGYARGISGLGSKIFTIADIPPDLHHIFHAKDSSLIIQSGISSPWKRFDLPAVLRIRKFMRQNAVEACIYHNGNSTDFLHLCKPPGTPLISVCHSHKLGRRLYADIILCLTDIQRDFAIRSLGRRAKHKLVATIGNPLVPAAVENPVNCVNKRLRNPQVIVGTLSSIGPRKGLEHSPI